MKLECPIPDSIESVRALDKAFEPYVSKLSINFVYAISCRWGINSLEKLIKARWNRRTEKEQKEILRRYAEYRITD